LMMDPTMGVEGETSMGGEMGQGVMDPEATDTTKTKMEMPKGGEI